MIAKASRIDYQFDMLVADVGSQHDIKMQEQALKEAKRKGKRRK